MRDTELHPVAHSRDSPVNLRSPTQPLYAVYAADERRRRHTQRKNRATLHCSPVRAPLDVEPGCGLDVITSYRAWRALRGWLGARAPESTTGRLARLRKQSLP